MNPLALTTTEIPARQGPASECASTVSDDAFGEWFRQIEGVALRAHSHPLARTFTDVYWWRLWSEGPLFSVPTGLPDHLAGPSSSPSAHVSMLSTSWVPVEGSSWTVTAAEPAQSVAALLADILGLTGMTREELAAALGVGRRTIYNWLGGQPASRAGQDKLTELANLLAPARRWDESSVSRWMRMGYPEPRRLLVEGNWAEFHDLLVRGPRRRPTHTSSVAVRMTGDSRTAHEEPEDDVDPNKLLAEMRAALRSTALGGVQRSDWMPPGLREVADK